jgi:hypothetical protein
MDKPNNPDEFSPELQAILDEEGITQESPQQQPPADVQVQVQEQSQGFDVGKAAADVLIGVPEAIGKGAVNSVGETIEGIYGIADWTTNRFGGDLPDKEYVPYEAETQTGKVLEPIARFVGGFVGAGKFLKLAGWANKGGKLLQAGRAAVQGGLADFFSFDAHEQRLSNLVQSIPALKNPVSEYLQAKPEDTEVEGRLKNLVEGLGLGVATDGLLQALKQLKRVRWLRATQGDAGAAKTLAKEADDGLDAIYPAQVETKVEGKVLTPEEAAQLTPSVDVEKVTNYAKEVNRILKEGGDPTKINLDPYIDDNAFQSADGIQQFYETLVTAIRDNDDVVHHSMTVEEAEKQFTQTVSNIADILDVSKESLTQTLLRDAKTIREAGVRSVVIANVLDAIVRRAEELAPLVKNLDDDAYKQLGQLQEAAHRIVPADTLVGTELGRSLNARQIRSSFGKDAAELLSRQMDPLELAEALQNAKNRYARSKLMQLTLDTISRVRINAMLSGPVTQMVNVSSNLFKTALTPAEHILGGAVQTALTRGAEGKDSIRQGLSLYRGLWGAMADSWRMAGSAIRSRKGVFRDGQFSQLDVFEDFGKAENLVTDPNHALKFASLEDLKASSELIQQTIQEGDYGKLTSMVWSTGLRTFGAVIDLPSTLLNGADEFFLNLNGRAMLYSQLTEEGLKDGLKAGSAELSQFVEDGFQRYFSNNGALIREDEIGRKAFAYATDANFSKEMTGDTIFGKVGMAMRRAQKDEGGFGFVMENIAPFVRTPVNLIEDVFNHVPGVNAILNQAVRDDLMAGGLRQARRIGEMVTGSMFLATAFGLVSQGLVTGAGPVNPQLRDQMKKAGWRPYSLRIPDSSVKGGFRYLDMVRFEPYSTYITVLADMGEALQAGERGDTQELYAKFLGSVMNNLSSKKYLTGLIDTMDLMSGMAYGDLESAERFVNNLAGSFVPSAAKTVRELEDPLFRDVRNLVDAMRNRTPFLSKNVPVQYDFRGKPTLTPILSVLTRQDMDDVDAEILRLSQLGGLVDTVSKRDSRLLSQFKNQDGKTAYERLGELMGQIGKDYYQRDFEGKTLTEYLRGVIRSKDYVENLSDPFTVNDGTDGMGGKVMTLRDIIASYREAAMDRLQAEGFTNAEGRLFTAIQEEKKASQQVQTEDDLQQFRQQQDSGGFDSDALQQLINQ